MIPLFVLALLADQARATRCQAERPAVNLALSRADAATAQRNPRQANRALDAGLQALGGVYQRPTMDDDTGMHLILANIAMQRGHLTRAAFLKRRILVERLGLCDGPDTR